MLDPIGDVICEESENEALHSNQQKEGFPAKACKHNSNKPCCGGCDNCNCTLILESESEKDNPAVE